MYCAPVQQAGYDSVIRLERAMHEGVPRKIRDRLSVRVAVVPFNRRTPLQDSDLLVTL